MVKFMYFLKVLNLIEYIVAGSVPGTGEVREVPKSVSLASYLCYIIIKIYNQIVVYCLESLPSN